MKESMWFKKHKKKYEKSLEFWKECAVLYMEELIICKKEHENLKRKLRVYYNARSFKMDNVADKELAELFEMASE